MYTRWTVLPPETNGRIIGGEVRSAHGVTASQIGNEPGVQTTVITRIDFIVQRGIQRIKALHQKRMLMMQKLDEQPEGAADERAT